MQLSKSCRWFSNVYWDEQNRSLSCLVDITKLEAREGYMLVNEGGKLKIYLVNQLQNMHGRILGAIIGKDCPLK